MGRRMRGAVSLPGARASRGQSLVEYAVTVPFFLLILLGMLEFGFAFSQHMTMEYSTREGSRTGAALNNGTAEFQCGGSNDQNVDNQVIAAVQRVLTGAGSAVKIAQVGEIRIYKANSSGLESGPVNVWKPGAGSESVGGVKLLFHRTSFGWNACGRDPDATSASDPVDSLGVSITYDYQFATPLASLMKIVGGGTLHMSDRTVMALNPDPL
jgi:hypothetical protein